MVLINSEKDNLPMTPAQKALAELKQKALANRGADNALALLPDRIVILCDTSISMETNFGKLSRVKAAEKGMRSIVSTSDPRSTAYSLFTYNTSAHLIHPMGTPFSKFAITELYAAGGTHIYYALEAAMAQNPTRIILLSDGEDSDTRILEYCTRTIKPRGVKVDTIAIGDAYGGNLMIQIAEITGGVFRLAKDDEELNQIFLSLEPTNYLRLEHSK